MIPRIGQRFRPTSEACRVEGVFPEEFLIYRGINYSLHWFEGERSGRSVRLMPDLNSMKIFLIPAEEDINLEDCTELSNYLLSLTCQTS